MTKMLSQTKKGTLKERVRLLRNTFYDDVDEIKYNLNKFKNNLTHKKSKTIDLQRNSETFKIAIYVSETGENASKGDYFTAMELGDGLNKLGYEVIFLPKNGLNYWYELSEDVDAVISMLDIFDPRRIKTNNSALIKIAWPRNWFDRWIINPGFKNYDIILVPSITSKEYIVNKTDKKPILFPIATNPDRFNGSVPQKKEFLCDYCFTGSYWNSPRDIIGMLEPDKLPYTFKLYGKNWDEIPKFKEYLQGFVNYTKLPQIYASTKIVVDDSNMATKNFGAVNSRVFDALACGTLVITNGVKGADETFNGKLPVFTSKKELNDLITYYLSNDHERKVLTAELQKFVLENHTYINRAQTFKKCLDEYTQNME